MSVPGRPISWSAARPAGRIGALAVCFYTTICNGGFIEIRIDFMEAAFRSWKIIAYLSFSDI